MNDALKKHGFRPGQSGNPGGRPSIAKALEANGTTTTEVLAKLAKIALDTLEDKTATPSAREYCHTWLTHYTIGKAPQAVDLTLDGGISLDPLVVDLVAAAKLTPHERRKAIAAADTEDDKAEIGNATDDDT